MKENITDAAGNWDSAAIFVHCMAAMPIVKLYSRNDNMTTQNLIKLITQNKKIGLRWI